SHLTECVQHTAALTKTLHTADLQFTSQSTAQTDTQNTHKYATTYTERHLQTVLCVYVCVYACVCVQHLKFCGEVLYIILDMNSCYTFLLCVCCVCGWLGVCVGVWHSDLPSQITKTKQKYIFPEPLIDVNISAVHHCSVCTYVFVQI